MINKDFFERYNKFKDNTLPTPFFDKERQTFEYVWFKDNDLNVSQSLSYSIEKYTMTGLYYSFTIKSEKDGKVVKVHGHSHSFEEVLNNLYMYPESFSIQKKDELYYSKQELEYLKKVKKYLNFIELKDINSYKKIPNTRYKNDKIKKYSKCFIYKINDIEKKLIKKNKLNFLTWKYYKNFQEKDFINGEYQALLVDKKYNFLYLIEFKCSKLKKYKDIKNILKIENKKDNSKIILKYFKILEKY